MRPKNAPRRPLWSTWPAITDDPASPGAGPNSYHPSVAASAGASSSVELGTTPTGTGGAGALQLPKTHEAGEDERAGDPTRAVRPVATGGRVGRHARGDGLGARVPSSARARGAP